MAKKPKLNQRQRDILEIMSYHEHSYLNPLMDPLWTHWKPPTVIQTVIRGMDLGRLEGLGFIKIDCDSDVRITEEGLKYACDNLR